MRRACARVQHATAIHFNRGKHLRAEQFGAAAIMRQRDKRIHRVEIALNRAEIRLERPEGQQNTRRHPIVLLRCRKHAGVAVRIGPPRIHAVLRNQRARKIQKRALENALPPVRIQNRLFLPDIGKEILDQGAVMSARRGFCFQALDKRPESAAAGLSLRMCRHTKGKNRYQNRKTTHSAPKYKFAPR